MSMWDVFENRLVITGDLIAETAFRVGAGGESLHPAGTDLPVVRDALGEPFIPGSSLRGVLRSHVERIVRALEEKPGDGQGACDPLSEDHWCIPRQRMAELRGEFRDHPDRLSQRVWELSCRVCRVFGSPWLASRVRITDLHLKPGAEAHVLVRDGVAIHRDKETVENKYDFEVVAPGAVFQLEIVADNLDESERGLLWLGLRELLDGRLRIGGFRGRGLGGVRLSNARLNFVSTEDRQAFLRYLTEGTMPELPVGTAESWLEKAIEEMAGGE